MLSDVMRHQLDAGATLVVAAAVASGRSLQAVSQLLRTTQKNGAITYLVGLARFPDKPTLDEVESNVSYGDEPKERGFFVIDRVLLPLVGSQTKTSWEQESALLNKALSAQAEDAVRSALEKRVQEITDASKTRGMSEGLFWRKIDGQPLVLRPGFAFFDFTPVKPASQADVYFTIAAVLHDLRTDRRSTESLFQHEYRRRVLSPRCFDRFNDGVIQAAILRAAHPAELDYSIDEGLSNDMWQVLDTIFSASSTQAGEATFEFLIALALKRLKLEGKDLSRLKAKFGTTMQDAVAQQLWLLIEN